MNERLMIGIATLMVVPFALASGNQSSAHHTHHWVNSKKVVRESVHAREVVRAGDLHTIINQLATSYGWKDIVWQSESNYQWHGTTVFKNKSLSQILGNVLKGYPLQAQFYDGNHVLVMTQRNLPGAA